MHEHRYPTKRCGTENHSGAQLEIASNLPKEKHTVRKIEECARDDSRRVPSMRDCADEVQDTVGEHEKPDPRSQKEA
jgi:hypothetical protein